MKWLVLLPLLFVTACVSPAEKTRRESARIVMEEQQRKDWAAPTPAQRLELQMMREADERERRNRRAEAVTDALQTMGNSMQQAAHENQQRYDANRPRSYHVRDNGMGTVTVTPLGY